MKIVPTDYQRERSSHLQLQVSFLTKFHSIGFFFFFPEENFVTFKVVQFSEVLVGERGADASRGNTEASVKRFYFLATQNQNLSLFFLCDK